MIINGYALFVEQPIVNMIGEKVQAHGLSYGLSEVGYDFRIKQEVRFKAPDMKAFHYYMQYGYTHLEQMTEALLGSVTVTDPDGHSVKTLGRTAIGSSIEEFQIPSHLWAEFRNKSTHARRFLDASLGTDGEPGWKGFLTIELVFNGNDDYALPAGCPILKAVFHEITEHRQYAGKYQHQPDRPVDAIFEK